MSSPTYASYPPHIPPAGRRVPRPASVELCPVCGEYLGRGYPGCAGCYEAVEAIWREDWLAFLAAEGVQAGTPDETLIAGVVVAEFTRHPWTIVDYALTRLRCEECGSELCGGPIGCATCAHAFGNLWAPELEAGATMAEHAIRVARLVTRHPHRYSAPIATGWRLSLPALLTGDTGSGADARRIANWLKAGGDPAEIAHCRTTAEVCAYLDRRAH
jgi:hypothetical protein